MGGGGGGGGGEGGWGEKLQNSQIGWAKAPLSPVLLPLPDSLHFVLAGISETTFWLCAD